MKNRLAGLCFAGLVWALTLSALPGIASAQTALIVHDGSADTTLVDVRAQLTTYLAAAGYTVTLNVGVPSGALMGNSQIWDVRPFNAGALSASDATAYTTYLNAGKSLFLMGENTNSVFATRNASITSFIAAVGGGTVTVSSPVSNTQTVQSPFTGPNAVTTVVWRNAANMTLGTGSAITTDSSNTGAAIVFPPGKLSGAPTGTLIVVFDVNFLQAAELAPLQSLAKNMIAYLAAPVAVGMTDQTITFAALANKAFGDAAFAVSATATSSLTVAFTSTTTSVCTVSSTTVTIVAAGTCTIAANQAGNSSFNPAPQMTQSFTVAKASQTITFAALTNKTLGDAAFTVSGSSTSSLTVAFSSTTTSVCTVSGTTVTLVGVGTCTIAADQSGNANYSAASQVTRSFTVACYTVSIGPAAFPIGAAGQPFSQALTLTNGTAPSTFALTGGTLPGGLALSAAGVLSGTPTTRGAFSITVTGTDANTCQVTQTYPVAISRERRIALGAGAGSAPTARVFDYGNSTPVVEFNAFASSFLGGVTVAQADVNGDGTIEIIAGAGPGASPQVSVFSPAGAAVRSFLAYDAGMSAGVEVAAGDLDGDGIAEIITSAGFGGPAVVRVFDGRTATMIRQFDRSALSAAGGMHVGIGDVNGDGRAEILVGAGGYSPSVIQVLDGITGAISRQVSVYSSAFVGGVYVAGGDITGDGISDIIAGAGAGGGPHVRVFDGLTGVQIPGALGSFYAYTTVFSGGVRVAAADLNRDGYADLIVGPGAGGGPHIRVFSGATGAELFGFYGFEPAFSSGTFVAAAQPMVRMSVDLPLAGVVSGASVRIAGWAIDESATSDSRIDAIHAWAFPVTGGAPVFVGAGAARGARTDVATLFGGEYLGSNFDVTGTLPAGTYDLVVFARSGRTLQVVNYRIVRIVVQ